MLEIENHIFELEGQLNRQQETINSLEGLCKTLDVQNSFLEHEIEKLKSDFYILSHSVVSKEEKVCVLADHSVRKPFGV